MTVGTSGFVAERLRQAREARGLSLNVLADLASVSSASLSQYEKGHHSPKPETTRRLSECLNLPLSFFLKPMHAKAIEDRIFYRSMSSATKQSRSRAERRFEWFKELVSYFDRYLDFPPTNLTDFGFPDDFRKLTSASIESAAEQLRASWRLGQGPVVDVIRTMEANGVFVTRGSLDAETLDAFSQVDHGRPYVFLNSDKNVLARSRFDCAHELGHLVLHRNVRQKDLNRAVDFKIIESQAHHFAGAFLIPAKSFQDELWALSLDSFRSMKARWKVSIAAMISRANQLQMLSEDDSRRMWINLNRRGWRQCEPLDDLPCEQPQLVAKAVNVLIEHRIKTKEQIVNDLALSEKDVCALLGLDAGFFSGAGTSDVALKPRSDNVVAFRR